MVSGLCVHPVGRQSCFQDALDMEFVRCLGADRYLAWGELDISVLGIVLFLVAFDGAVDRLPPKARHFCTYLCVDCDCGGMDDVSC